jgi:chemotaxis protein methyltransferase CheR
MEYERIRRLIEDKCGVNLGADKAYLVESRLVGLLTEYDLSSFDDLYLRIMQGNDPNLVEKVIDAVVTNETFWFRDKAPWVTMEDILLPAYIKELAEGKRSKVRIWSAACSSGQEPYSIAMCIDRFLRSKGVPGASLSQFEILATDISSTIIQIASAGRYDSISITRGLDNEYRDLYFENIGRVWTISDRIKKAVEFRQFNLQSDFYSLGKFDIVFLRNVLIYFSDDLKREITNKTASVLEKDGVLFIGSSELFDSNKERFSSELHKEACFYRIKPLML